MTRATGWSCAMRDGSWGLQDSDSHPLVQHCIEIPGFPSYVVFCRLEEGFKAMHSKKLTNHTVWRTSEPMSQIKQSS